MGEGADEGDEVETEMERALDSRHFWELRLCRGGQGWSRHRSVDSFSEFGEISVIREELGKLGPCLTLSMYGQQLKLSSRKCHIVRRCCAT